MARFELQPDEPWESAWQSNVSYLEAELTNVQVSLDVQILGACLLKLQRMEALTSDLMQPEAQVEVHKLAKTVAKIAAAIEPCYYPCFLQARAWTAVARIFSLRGEHSVAAKTARKARRLHLRGVARSGKHPRMFWEVTRLAVLFHEPEEVAEYAHDYICMAFEMMTVAAASSILESLLRFVDTVSMDCTECRIVKAGGGLCPSHGTNYRCGPLPLAVEYQLQGSRALSLATPLGWFNWVKAQSQRLTLYQQFPNTDPEKLAIAAEIVTSNSMLQPVLLVMAILDSLRGRSEFQFQPQELQTSLSKLIAASLRASGPQRVPVDTIGLTVLDLYFNGMRMELTPDQLLVRYQALDKNETQHLSDIELLPLLGIELEDC
jgi:hypothetical protein